MQSESPPPSDRRTSERHLACFPAEVTKSGGESRFSMIRDLSRTGALLLVRTAASVGDRVELDLHLSENGDRVRSVAGKVVRVEPLSPHEAGIWMRKIAVQFDAPLEISDAELELLRERRERLGLK